MKMIDIEDESASFPEGEGTYLIVKQPDGNYKGYTFKFGNLIQVRDIGPETVMQLLLTHNGQTNA